MSIIAVKGVPLQWSLLNVSKALAKAVRGQFETLNFRTVGNIKSGKSKVCYIRLSEKLDPVRVVEQINNGQYSKGFKPFAYVPNHVPDLPLATKPRKIPQKLCRALKIADDDPPEMVVSLTIDELLTELQLKYPGLYNLSKKMGHELLEELGKKISGRFKEIETRHPEAIESCFKLSQWYRRVHPHFGDFQLVLSTLHALEDAAGTPRTQLQEKELATLPPLPFMFDKSPSNKINKACTKYSERIIKKISEHIKNLKSDVCDTDTGDEIVRKKIREELKKMAPFMPQIVSQVVAKHFMPLKSPNYRVRIYGEPFLPSKETMSPFVRRYQPLRVLRSTRVYNMLRFSVPPAHLASLMAMDGTVLNGAKLVIRSSDMPLYKVSSRGVPADDDLLAAEDEPLADWSEV